MKKSTSLALLLFTAFLVWGSWAGAENTADETVRISASDDTSGRLQDKLDEGAGILIEKPVTGGNEKLKISTRDKLSNKGDLLSHDGFDDSTLSVGGTNGQVLVVDSAAANGIKWDTPDDLSAPGPIGDTTPSTGEFTDLNATTNLKLQGLAFVTFAIEIKNNSGTLQHRTNLLASPVGNGGTDAFPSGVTGLSGTWNNIPTVGTSTDFTAGVGFSAVSSSQVLELNWTQDQAGNPPFIFPEIIFNSTGEALTVVCVRTSGNINGTTKSRHGIYLYDISGNKKTWVTNSTNPFSSSGNSLIILVKGWVKV